MGQRNKLVKVSQSSTLAQNRLTVVEDEWNSRGLDASGSELGLRGPQGWLLRFQKVPYYCTPLD